MIISPNPKSRYRMITILLPFELYPDGGAYTHAAVDLKLRAVGADNLFHQRKAKATAAQLL